MVVAQLVEWSLPTTEFRGSNPNISEFSSANRKVENKKKRPGMPHLKKVLFSQQSRTSDIWVGSANSCLSAAPFALEVIFQKFNWVVQPRIEKYFEADSFRFVSVQNFALGVARTFRKKTSRTLLATLA